MKGTFKIKITIGSDHEAIEIKDIRYVLCNDVFSAKISCEHNDANILAMGGRVLGFGSASEIVRARMTTDFSNGERHARRKRFTQWL